MDWSGTSPIPDDDGVPRTLTPEEVRRRQSQGSNWIVAVAIVLCLVPFAVWVLYNLI